MNQLDFIYKTKYMLTIMFMNLLKLLWFLPIHSNDILFISFSGKEYSDSPLFLSEYIINNYNMNVIWTIYDKLLISDKRIKTVKPNGIGFIITFLTCGTIITNNTVESYLPIRKKQILLNTWHGGGPGKTIGFRDNIVEPYFKYSAKIQNKKTTAVLSSSSFCTKEVMQKSLGFDREKIIETGLPRNDLFFKNTPCIREKVLSYFGIEKSPQIGVILYAPTFRGNSSNGNFINESEYPPLQSIAKILGHKYNKKFYILFRAHHAMKVKNVQGTISASKYPNMQELLYVVDVLITDYSSCMHDFSLMKKPVFLYTPDYEKYMAHRGFYMGIENMPFPFAKTVEQLLNNVETFDLKQYEIEVNNYLSNLGNIECGESTSKVIRWLENQWRGQ